MATRQAKPQPILASMLASCGTEETSYIPIGNGYQQIKKCGPTENRSVFIQPPAEYNKCGLALSNPLHPPYTDPLYAPYLDKNQTFFACNTSKYKRNPPYPIVDPGRMRMGDGIRFRTQHEGICPLGYVMGPNSMCFAADYPTGYFYGKQVGWRFPNSGVMCENTESLEYDDWDPRTW